MIKWELEPEFKPENERLNFKPLKRRLALEFSIWGGLKRGGDGCFSNPTGLKPAIHQPFLVGIWRKIKPSLNLIYRRCHQILALFFFRTCHVHFVGGRVSNF